MSLIFFASQLKAIYHQMSFGIHILVKKYLDIQMCLQLSKVKMEAFYKL